VPEHLEQEPKLPYVPWQGLDSAWVALKRLRLSHTTELEEKADAEDAESNISVTKKIVGNKVFSK
jgi:hypothetical protein